MPEKEGGVPRRRPHSWTQVIYRQTPSSTTSRGNKTKEVPCSDLLHLSGPWRPGANETIPDPWELCQCL